MQNRLQSVLLNAARVAKLDRLADTTTALQRLLGAKPVEAIASSKPGVVREFISRLSDLPASARNDHARAHLDTQGAQFTAAHYSGQGGSRPYKLYVPRSYHGQRVPLIVMLHGCTQSPDDFAAGTRMNDIAEEQGFIVAYPVQTNAANMQKCWNWFTVENQQRDAGEPAIIAGITREIMRSHAIDPRRVYIAGLSAGGAAAAVMANTYPDLYAAVGVHSGLACGAAGNMPSAFSAMQKGSAGAVRPSAPSPTRPIVAAIVFHGDRDTTVNPRNGDAVVAQLQSAATAIHTEQGTVSGGHAYSRTTYAGDDGHALVEHWVIKGAGHAWSGGSSQGSFTDPRGPDASREMVRFFLDAGSRK